MLTERPARATLPPAGDFLDPAVPPPACLAALSRLGFLDPAGALANLRRLAETPELRDQVAPVLPRLLHHLGVSPDPDMALNNLERLAAAALDRRGFYTLLAAHPEAIPILTTLAATSQFLTDALIRSPQTMPWLLDPRVMQARSREAMHAEVAGACRPFRTEEARLNALRRVKRRELCRIGLRDLLGDADLVTTTQELSELADACLAQAIAMVEPALHERYGGPGHVAADGGRVPTGFAVIALGKHGGAELNYSSDIDLCFVYEAEGETDGPEVVSNRAYFARLAEQLIGAMTAMTEEGTVFRVDLRLRPEGTGGPLALPLAAYRAYHQTRGALWERQALIKARVAAGDERVGQAFLDLAREIVYRSGMEREALGEIRAMKNRIDRRLRARGQQERHVKLGVGGIRDIEFHIQALQLFYGGQDPWLRERNSLRALHRLAERGYLSWEESGRLAHAYVFLRTIEHRLSSSTRSRRTRSPPIRTSSGSWRGASGTRGTGRRPRPPSSSTTTGRARPSARRSKDSSTRPGGRSRSRRPGKPQPSPASASPIRSGPGRTSGSSGRGRRWWPCPPRCGPRSARSCPPRSTRSGPCPIRTRRSTRWSASSPPRARGRPTSRGSRRRPRFSGACSPSSPGRSGSRRR